MNEKLLYPIKYIKTYQPLKGLIVYVSPINNQQFKGTTKFLSCNSDGKQRRVSEYPFGRAYFGETRGLADFVKRHSFPNASVEETIGKFHDDKTYKIYVADPCEIVDDFIRQHHDYIVYDNEPDFPDIRRNYFDSPNEVENGFKNIQAYFSRLDALEDGKDIMQDSRLVAKRKLAHLCEQIFGESEDLLEQKSALESKIEAKKDGIRNVNDNISDFTAELSRKKRALENTKQILTGKKNRLKLWINKYEKIKAKINPNSQEKENALFKINDYNEKIAALESKVEKYKKRISFLEIYLADAPKKIQKYQTEMAYSIEQLAKIKQELLPNFKKLCRFYTQQGIKIIKEA